MSHGALPKCIQTPHYVHCDAPMPKYSRPEGVSCKVRHSRAILSGPAVYSVCPSVPRIPEGRTNISSAIVVDSKPFEVFRSVYSVMMMLVSVVMFEKVMRRRPLNVEFPEEENRRTVPTYSQSKQCIYSTETGTIHAEPD